jgi:hypothetical protein
MAALFSKVWALRDKDITYFTDAPTNEREERRR